MSVGVRVEEVAGERARAALAERWSGHRNALYERDVIELPEVRRVAVSAARIRRAEALVDSGMRETPESEVEVPLIAALLALG